MYVDAGELNKRIEIFRKPKLGPDGYLPEGAEPELVRRCWAKFSQTRGTELQRNNADLGEALARFLIRASHIPIDRKMFVRYRGIDHEILYVNSYRDNGEYLELWCEWLSEGVMRHASETA